MNTDQALTLLIALLSQANEIGRLIRQAQAEGRDITDAELDALAIEDDAARARLAAAIEAARAHG